MVGANTHATPPPARISAEAASPTFVLRIHRDEFQQLFLDVLMEAPADDETTEAADKMGTSEKKSSPRGFGGGLGGLSSAAASGLVASAGQAKAAAKVAQNVAASGVSTVGLVKNDSNASFAAQYAAEQQAIADAQAAEQAAAEVKKALAASHLGQLRELAAARGEMLKTASLRAIAGLPDGLMDEQLLLLVEKASRYACRHACRRNCRSPAITLAGMPAVTLARRPAFPRAVMPSVSPICLSPSCSTSGCFAPPQP